MGGGYEASGHVVAVLDDGGVLRMGGLRVQDQAEDQCEYASPHADVADHAEVDAGYVVAYRETEDRPHNK